jgi:hypothetical protein
MNKEYVCKRCGYATIVKANFIRHLKAVSVCCAKLVDISRDDLLKEVQKNERKGECKECEYCTKKLTKTNITRHYATCAAKKQAEDGQASTSNHTETTRTPEAIALHPQIDMELLVRTPEFQRALEEKLKQYIDEKLQSANTVNNYNTINIQQNISLNSFGQENTSHLTHEFLSHCLMNPTKGLQNLIDTIHYNADVPENHNLRFKSNKNNTVEKYVDSHWIECDATNTLDELIRKGYRILNSHYSENYLNDPDIQENEIRARALEKFRFLGDKTCNDYHSVRRDLRCLIKDKTMYWIASP